MKKGMVSIITPMYNGERFVGQTIESVLAQTYPDWEMIVVDDGSKDGGAQIVEGYAKEDDRIKLIRQANAGSAAARNNALEKAQGQFIVFIDSDDLVFATFLEKQLAFMREKDASLVFSSYQRISEQGEECLKPFIVPQQVTYRDILKTNPISCLTALYDCSKLGKYYFRPELRSLRDDYAMWLEVLKHVDKAYGNQEILASYRVFASSTTGNKRKVIKPQFMVYYQVEKLGLVRSLYYTCRWAISGYLKYKR